MQSNISHNIQWKFENHHNVFKFLWAFPAHFVQHTSGRGHKIRGIALDSIEPWTLFSMNSRVRTDILWPGSRLLIAHNANAYPSVTQASPPAPPPPLSHSRTDTCQIFRITTFCRPAPPCPPCPLRGIIIERFVLCVCVSLRVEFICPCHASSSSPWSSSAAGQATLARRSGCGFSVQLEWHFSFKYSAFFLHVLLPFGHVF